jgi:malate dehydrogenase (oxaloacetate-decarboxylating)(NADP+)
LELVKKKIEKTKFVINGAGAAAMACVKLYVAVGAKPENFIMFDKDGVLNKARTDLDAMKQVFATSSKVTTLAEAMKGADVFVGLSVGNVVTADMVKSMAKHPIVFAMANPDPEIPYDVAIAARPDVIMATGRSDYPNQVNNVLGFPYIFRGALDVRATQINEEMKLAAVRALAELAFAESDERVAAAYGAVSLSFGPEYLIPKPFDSRLITKIPPAVARAAMESGVATRPITDFPAYQEKLSSFVFRSGLVMKPLFDRARQDAKRVVYSEGESTRVLRAVQTAVDEGLAKPIVVGRRAKIEAQIKSLDLRLKLGEDVELVDPENNPRWEDFWHDYHNLMARKGISPEAAQTLVRTRNTIIASLLVRRGEADALVCGAIGLYARHLEHIEAVIGKRPGVKTAAAMSLMILDRGTYFLCDPYVSHDPTAEQIADMTVLAADEVRRFGIEPKVALLSHSNFGGRPSPTADKMRAALELLREQAPTLEVDGEMHADAALSEQIRRARFPGSTLKGAANLLVMPNMDAAHISLNMLKMLADGITVGPILLGMAAPAHIVTQSVTVRGLINITALAVVDAQMAATRRNGS